jgi:hypothetical protein
MGREGVTYGAKENACLALVEELKDREHFEDVGELYWKGICLTEMGWEGVGWTDLAQDRVRWRVLVNTVTNFRIP